MALQVLVPLDGSELGEPALPSVQALAGRQPLDLLLVSVIEVSTEFASWSQQVREQREMQDQVNERRRYLNEAARRIGVANARTEIRVGTAARELLTCAEECGASLIVMSTHAYGGVRRMVLGSVASRVVQGFQGAILLIRTDEAADVAAFERVLIPVDGSPLSERAVETAREILGEPRPALHLVRVLGTPRWAPEGLNQGLVYEFMQASQEMAEEELEQLAERLRAEGHTVTSDVRLWGDVVTQILTAADEWKPDLIAMGTHGRGGLRRVVLGSVADGVLQRGTHPLLLIRPSK